MTASSVIRLPGLNFSLGTIYSQAAVHLAVSVASRFRAGVDKSSGNLPTACRHPRPPRILNGQDAVRSNPSSYRACGHHRLTTSLQPQPQSRSGRFSSSRVHAPGWPSICSCGGAGSFTRPSRLGRIVFAGLSGLQLKPGHR